MMSLNRPTTIDMPGEIKAMVDSSPNYCMRRFCVFVLATLIVLDCNIHIYVYKNLLKSSARIRKNRANELWTRKNQTFYKYPLVNGSEVSMDYDIGYNSSYFWFKSMQPMFKDLSPIFVNMSEPDMKWVEEQNSDVMAGGYYAPNDCKPAHRVAIIVAYRDRRVNLAIFLRYIHPFLKKQLLEYRIFVIEQYGTEKFNKGTLYNIAFLETQRFGNWHCLIFHDVDLVPEDERIPYSCPELPTHLSAAVKSFGYILPYRHIFGGVTVITPKDYITVNGYSNFYWNWGAEDDDFLTRYLLFMLSKIRFQKEGLVTTKYKVLRVTEEKLYTRMLADVNPTKMKLNMKSVMQRMLRLYGETIVYGRREFTSSNHIPPPKDIT